MRPTVVNWPRSASTNGPPSPVFTPDGRNLLSGGRDEKLRRWDIGTGKETACWPSGVREVESLAIASEGTTLAVAGTLRRSPTDRLEDGTDRVRPRRAGSHRGGVGILGVAIVPGWSTGRRHNTRAECDPLGSPGRTTRGLVRAFRGSLFPGLRDRRPAPLPPRATTARCGSETYRWYHHNILNGHKDRIWCVTSPRWKKSGDYKPRRNRQALESAPDPQQDRPGWFSRKRHLDELFRPGRTACCGELEGRRRILEYLDRRACVICSRPSSGPRNRVTPRSPGTAGSWRP